MDEQKPKGATTTCRSRTSSGSIVSSNEDLMVSILSRLAVKELSRFKCVNKQWNMLISDPYFVNSHYARATQVPNVMKAVWVRYQDMCISVCSIQDKEQERIVTRDVIRPNYSDASLEFRFVLMAGRPCHGLICLITFGGIETSVCNPATRNTLLIPRGTKRKLNWVLGLGFCSSSNEFKVARLFQRSEEPRLFGCELFTVGQRGAQGRHLLQHSRRSWRDIGNFPYQIVSPKQDMIMCGENGSAHWLIRPSSSSVFILSLDLQLEEFKVVSCPQNWEKYARSSEFGLELKDLGGELCVVVSNKGIHRQEWDIWMLKDYTHSIWSKEYNFNLKDHPFIRNLSLVAICRRRLLLEGKKGNSYFYYDLRNNFLEKAKELPCVSLRTPYVESLVMPF